MFFFSKNFFRSPSKMMITSVAILSISGLATLFSSLLGRYRFDTDFNIAEPLLVQFMAFAIGIFLVYVFSKINYRYLKKYALPILFLSFIFSFLVFLDPINGNTSVYRWIFLFGFSIQPTEILKIAIIIFFAALLSNIKYKKLDLKHYVWGISIIVILFLLNANQPDGGTFVVIMLAVAIVLIFASLNWKFYATLFSVGAILFSIFATSNQYVGDRVVTYVKQLQGNLTDDERLGAAYHISQAQLAIGSGGIFGRGFADGTQKFGFLPESSTDSIIAIFFEEYGFFGAIVLMSVIMLFVYSGHLIALNAPDRFGMMLSIGLLYLIAIQAFINIFVLLNLLPVTGIPFPFYSKGGSAIIGIFISIGILLSIAKEIEVNGVINKRKKLIKA